ncbi:hypothetical protein QJQ45_013339 [Haematococcus lacustris]|nr:hypothetical protein QJQ45_013339 [Haematococcus lacustris]
MVYSEHGQTKRYFVRPEPFLSTSAHFHDATSSTESPAPEFRVSGTPHKRSTAGKLHTGSHHTYDKLMADSTAIKTAVKAKKDKLELFPAPLMHTRSLPHSTYRGNGSFTVELPHTSLTYRSLKLVPFAQLSWKSEYSDHYVKKEPSPHRGYSVLSQRRSLV